jgi:diguanylate cyclase (GGDEF)-like protein
VIRVTSKLRGVIKQHNFIVEVLAIVMFAGIIFWFAQDNDAFEYLVDISREHEDWELDEVFTLLMISAFAFIIIIYRNGSYLRAEMRRRVLVEKEIKRLAFYDGLTGLPNRDLCSNRLEHTLSHSARSQTMAAVLFIDLDNFKEVNDTFGHEGGDELLIQASQRLSSDIRSGDTLARIAGDEFVIVLESLTSITDISVLAEKLLAKIALPFLIYDQEAYVGISIGIATFPRDGTHSQKLMKNADTAMYYAKNSGKNTFKFFSTALNKESENKQKIASQLRKAIGRHEFTLHFQPIVNVITGEITGAEALLRWNSLRLGNISPDIFIPIAEDIGVISAIGDWVLLEACRQNKRWQDQGYPHIVMSVNMSGKELALEYFTKAVEESLDKSGLEAKYLELELTENAIIQDIEQSIKQLAYLKKLGVSIALDDFGTGYSSMSNLRQLNLSRIKIDRKFIRDIPDNVESAITIQAIINLANNLGFQITAEGVESQSQYTFIKNTQTNLAQGFYFSKAVTPKQFERLFKMNILPLDD